MRMIRIDAHHHLWDTSRRDYAWMDGPWADPLRGSFDVSALAPLAAAAGIGATVVVQACADLDETRELLLVADRTPLIVGVVGWVDLTAPDVSDVLAALRAGPGGSKLVGVRHQVQDEPDPRWLLRADVSRGLRAVAAAGLAYDLLVRPAQLPAAVEVAHRMPEVRFVLDHLAKPEIAARRWEPWALGLTRLAAAPNVSAKLSGLVTEADWRAWTPAQLLPYVRHAVDAFGPGRLMFGSDWPVCLLAADYHTVLTTAEGLLADLGHHVGHHDHRAIFGSTAATVYRLDR